MQVKNIARYSYPWAVIVNSASDFVRLSSVLKEFDAEQYNLLKEQIEKGAKFVTNTTSLGEIFEDKVFYAMSIEDTHDTCKIHTVEGFIDSLNNFEVNDVVIYSNDNAVGATGTLYRGSSTITLGNAYLVFEVSNSVDGQFLKLASDDSEFEEYFSGRFVLAQYDVCRNVKETCRTVAKDFLINRLQEKIEALGRRIEKDLLDIKQELEEIRR